MSNLSSFIGSNAVKSIQKVTMDYAQSGTINYTISPVNTAKSLIVVSQTNDRMDNAIFYFTNSSTVTFYSGLQSYMATSDVYPSFYIVEFN